MRPRDREKSELLVLEVAVLDMPIGLYILGPKTKFCFSLYRLKRGPTLNCET